MKHLSFLSVILIMIASLSMTGCATKADPAQSAGFVDSSQMSKDPSLPFHKVWIKPGFDKSQYNQLYVAPVSTKYMLRMTEWQKGVRASDIKDDVGQVAIYVRESVKKAFREDSQRRFRILHRPTRERGTLNLEIAITEIVPSKVALNALGYAPFGIGFGVKAVRAMAKDVSTVAVEAKVTDAATGETIFMLSDRNAQQTTVISTNDLSWYGHAYSIIDNWAKKLVQVANRKPGAYVKDTSAFTLKAW